MLRSFLLLVLIFLPICACADETEDQLKNFLKSREVIDQVYFATASEQLSSTSREKLDTLVSLLTKLSQEGCLLRVEGFASPVGNDAKNVNLSMYRAMAVRNYFRDKHGLNLDLFLTGYGSLENEMNKGDSRRVDIAKYIQPEAAMALFDDRGIVEKIQVK